MLFSLLITVNTASLFWTGQNVLTREKKEKKKLVGSASLRF